MNIYFMDHRFVKPENWKYLIEVLKIKRVFCFCHSKDFKIELDLNRENVPIAYQQNMEDEKFSNKITYYIANSIKDMLPKEDNHSADLNERFPYCKDSKYYSPRSNIKNTEDPNILVIGIINWSSWDKSIFIKEVSSNRDIAANIVQYALNILKKQLNTDIYRQRICAYMIDQVSSQEFFIKRYSWTKPKKVIIPFINTLLRNTYPDIFPPIKEGDKIKATPFSDQKILKEKEEGWKEYLQELKREEELEWQAMKDEWQAMEDAEYERRMIEDFWNELGENAWNID